MQHFTCDVKCFVMVENVQPLFRTTGISSHPQNVLCLFHVHDMGIADMTHFKHGQIIFMSYMYVHGCEWLFSITLLYHC